MLSADSGRRKLTDNVGRVVNFRNTIILMTSNVGSDTIKKQSSMGFSPISDENSYEKMREKILDEAKKTFRPEFLNRLDDIIVFRSLTKPDLIQILDLEISKVMERLKARNIILDLDEKAKDFWSAKATTRNTAHGQCAALWNDLWKILWRRKSSKALSTRRTDPGQRRCRSPYFLAEGHG